MTFLDLNLLVALDALMAEPNVTGRGTHFSQPAMSAAAWLLAYSQDEQLL
ncbi:hypothetical protein SAMCCGM7_pB0153 (plasmid) [Sinorhizobium americanum CCGM7]|nr:hypothetical protein [Sinorhizobium americanum]APG86868.1 hypothetical protein SAMCCGM7_pB0153 [Sinorhizobium americanum CCGM7]